MHFFSVGLLLVLCGCEHGRGVERQAAFNERCPEEKVKVVRFADGYNTAELDVCGRRRVYHNVLPNNVGTSWVDVTPSTED